MAGPCDTRKELTQLPLGVKARRLLQRIGIRTLDELKSARVIHPGKARYVGAGTLAEVAALRDFLARAGGIGRADPVAVLPLTAKACNAVEQAGIRTVGEFLGLEPERIAGFHGCGREAQRQIRNLQDLVLAETGLAPRGNPTVPVHTHATHECGNVWPRESVLSATLPAFMQVESREVDTLWELFTEAGSVSDLLTPPPDTMEQRASLPLLDDPAETLLGLTLARILSEMRGDEACDWLLSATAGLISRMSGVTLEHAIRSSSGQPFMSEDELHGFGDCPVRSMPIASSDRIGVFDLGVRELSDLTRHSERQLLERFSLCARSLQNIAHLHQMSQHVRLLVPRWHEAGITMSRLGSLGEVIAHVAKETLSSREATVYLLRSGVSTGSRITLEEVSGIIGRTRGRAWQMHAESVKAMKRQSANPLAERVCIETNQCVEHGGGIVELSQLANHLARRFGWPHPPAAGLVAEVASLWTRLAVGAVDLRDPALPCVGCQQLLERLRAHVQGGNHVTVSQVADVELPRCAADCPRSRDLPRQFGEYAATQIIRSVAHTAHGLSFDGGDIYDLSHWRLHRGPVAGAVAEVLRQAGQPLNAEEIRERIAVFRPGTPQVTAQYVYSCLTRQNGALLWDRGRYIHADHVSVPVSHVKAVHDWILRTLRAEGLPFMSCFRALGHFAASNSSYGIPSEYALCSVIRIWPGCRLSIPKNPYAYPPGERTRISLALAIEIFIEEQGAPVSIRSVREYALDRLGLKDYIWSVQIAPNLTGVIQTEADEYVHVSNLPLSPGGLSIIAAALRHEVDVAGHASVVRAYEENAVPCRLMGITDPMMLFTALREYHDDLLSFGTYPQVLPADQDPGAYRGLFGVVVEYIRSRETFCTVEELEDYFVEEQRYGRRTVCNAIAHSPEVLPYLPGCIIHEGNIGWNGQCQAALDDAARECLDEAALCGKPYALLSDLLECRLPVLRGGLMWTQPLLRTMLSRSTVVTTLPRPASAFVLKGNSHGIEDMMGLLCWVVGTAFRGGTNIASLSDYLVVHRITDRKLGRAAILPGHGLAIVADEVLLEELVSDRAD